MTGCDNPITYPDELARFTGSRKGHRRPMSPPRPSQRRPDPPGRAPLRGMTAWAAYDWASNSFPTIVQTFLFANYFAGSVATDETAGTTRWH